MKSVVFREIPRNIAIFRLLIGVHPELEYWANLNAQFAGLTFAVTRIMHKNEIEYNISRWNNFWAGA